MKALKKRVGEPNSPIGGDDDYQSDLFIGGTMEFIIWNNNLMNDIWEFDPDFEFDPVTGIVKLLRNNHWYNDDAVIFCYTPKCSC